MKVLHLGSAGGIMDSFIEFTNRNFPLKDHRFLLSAEAGYSVPCASNVVDLRTRPQWLLLWRQARDMNHAEKIILHGLFSLRIIALLLFQPWLLKKTYWVIWGGDLYAKKLGKKTTRWHIKEFGKRILIPRIGYLITHIRGDYELAKLWYQAEGLWLSCFMYPSNIYSKKKDIVLEPHKGINVLLGNSATPTNNHMELFEQLLPYVEEDVLIYCPLSYGDSKFADEVEREGKKLFGEKFVALRQFMQLDSYLEFLQEIDVALFNHNRQQGVGNITTLLGMGKKVYLRSNITTWDMLRDIGVVIFDISKIELKKINSDDALRNNKIIRESFNEEQLKSQWSKVYE